MAEENRELRLEQALSGLVDNYYELHSNGENCPDCGGEYIEDDDALMSTKHDDDCALAVAITVLVPSLNMPECITGPDGQHACYANGNECGCDCKGCVTDAEPEGLFTVMVMSEVYGREFFRYDTLPEALAAVERLHNEAVADDADRNANDYDSIERVIGLVMNHNPDNGIYV